MEIIESFLTGKTSAIDFVQQIKSNIDLQKALRQLVPEEAKNNQSSLLWKNISYNALKRHDFDCLKLLNNTCKYDCSIGDTLNLFGYLKRIYSFEHPELPYTTKYHNMFGIYLDAIQDCFDGPEVEGVVEKIIQKALISSNAKTKQRSMAKAMVKDAFHVIDRKRPRWIQGPEWPMGMDSPMQFIEQKRKGEAVHYVFRDVTTGELRTIIQWY